MSRMVGLSYASDSDDDAVRRARGYAAALVSTSLGSESSFRMPSPVRSPTAQRRPRPESSHPRARGHKDLTPDSSLDELIDSFRASASSLKFASARDVPRSDSPVKRTRPTSEPTRQAPSNKPKGILRTDGHRQAAAERNEHDVVGLSPMPKLTYVPKPKPSLSMPAPTKSHSSGGIRPPSKLQPPKNAFPSATGKKINRSKLVSPKKYPSRVKDQAPQSSPPSPPSSDLSTTSSAIEDIEAPDSDDAGEISVDDLISRDLRHLQRLVSSSHEQLVSPQSRLPDRHPTTEEIERSFRRSTRFRVDDDDEPTSSFRLYSPHNRSPSTSPFHLEPVQSLLHRHRTDNQRSLQQEDDSFVEELQTMKSNLLKEKDKKKNAEAEAKKKQEEEEKKKADDGPGARIASLREAVDTIDKNLLLALRPFEKMKQEQDKEDAKVAVESEKADQQLELPMATQALVEQLEQAFGGLTRQREADIKAEEDAATQAKAMEDAQKKDEDEKKALEEANRKREEDEILSLLPLRGRLMNTQSDISDALVRLEVAETQAWNAVRYPVCDPDLLIAPARDLASLREFANRRAQEIQDLMCAPPLHHAVPRAVDWHRSTFDVDAENDTELDPAAPDTSAAPEADSYSDIVQSEVMEKLDFTILKLRHALSIDQKEAAEAAARKRQIDAETADRERKKAEEKSKQAKLESDSAAAKQRVMGISSLQELPWVEETDARLRQSVREDPALERLQSSVDAHATTRALPSFFDEQLAAERFETVRMMMDAPHLLSAYKSHVPSISSGNLDQRSRLPSQETSNWRHRHSVGHFQDMHVESVQNNRVFRRRGTSIFEDTENTSFMSPRPNNQVDDRQTRSRWGSSHENAREEIDQRKGTRSPSKDTHRYRERDSMVDMKRAIYELQADRREKSHWFRNSAWSR